MTGHVVLAGFPLLLYRRLPGNEQSLLPTGDDSRYCCTDSAFEPLEWEPPFAAKKELPGAICAGILADA